MRISRLVRILKTFTKEEFKDFEKFTASPYFARGRQLLPLLEVLKRFHPSFDQKELTTDFIFGKLYPGKQINSKASRDLIKTLSHELAKMCEEFLIQVKFRSDSNSRNYYLLSHLRVKRLFKEFEKHYSKALTDLNTNHGGSVYDFMDNYFLFDVYNEYCIDTKKYNSSFETIAAQDELAAIVGLIRGYRSFEFKYAAPLYNLKSPQNFSELMIRNLDSVKLLEEMKSRKDKYYPFAAINYLSFMISEYPDEEKYYFDFKKLFFSNLDLFGHSEKYIHFSRLTSYCIMATIKANNKFLREEFNLYDMSLNLGVHKWSPEDYFSIHHFRNMVMVAIELKEFAWLENFIQRFSNQLPKEDIENMRNYSNALLNYERKEFEKAFDNIREIKINFTHYKFDIKNLTFKIYYEMNLYELAFSVLESIRQYLPNAREMPEIHRKRNRNFVKFAKKLLLLKSFPERNTLEFIEEAIEEEELISSRDWLLEKLHEIKLKLHPSRRRSDDSYRNPELTSS